MNVDEYIAILKRTAARPAQTGEQLTEAAAPQSRENGQAGASSLQQTLTLEQRARKLSLRERQLADWAEQLTGQTHQQSERAMELSSWDSELEERAANLDHQAHEQGNIHDFLAGWDRELKQQRDDLARRERELEQKAALLACRERALEQKKAALAPQLQAAREAAEERQTCARLLENTYQELYQQSQSFQQVIQNFQTLQKSYQSFCPLEGLRQFCLLARELQLEGSPASLCFAERAGELLEQDFSCVPFSPAPGEAFDPVRMEMDRADPDLQDRPVVRTICPGWMRDGRLLCRAIVSMNEKE